MSTGSDAAVDLAEAIDLLRGSAPVFEDQVACGEWWKRWAALVGRHTTFDEEDARD